MAIGLAGQIAVGLIAGLLIGGCHFASLWDATSPSRVAKACSANALEDLEAKVRAVRARQIEADRKARVEQV